MRRGGGQTDLGSVSEPCQSEAFLRGMSVSDLPGLMFSRRDLPIPFQFSGDYHKSFTAESRMYQHSVDIDRPSSVSWLSIALCISIG